MDKKIYLLAGNLLLIALLISLWHSVSARDHGSNQLVYLPVMQRIDQPTNLDNRGTVVHPDGVGIGAYGTTLPHPIHVEIVTTAVPTTPFPAGVQALAGYYEISANENINVSTTAPFVLAFPVPAGAPTDNLAAGVLMTDTDYLDGLAGEPVWYFFDGKYDSTRNLFLTTISFLAKDGRPFVLVEHPGIPSPPNQSQPANNNARVTGNFVGICRGFFAGECPQSAADQVAALAEEAYLTFSNLGYPEPRLKVLTDVLEWPPSSNGLIWSHYPIYLEPSCGEFNHGRYQQWSGELILCQDIWTGGIAYQSARHKTLIHEYFHALQFGYAKVWADYNRSKDESWIIEGTARAVQESYFTGEMKRSRQSELHPVDVRLREETESDYFWIYSAQDFWVYTGQIGGGDMGYLQYLFAWGVSTESVKAVMPQLGLSFPDVFWRWSKNQFMDKLVDTDNALGTPCILDHEEPVADPAKYYQWLAQSQFSQRGTIPPLSSAIVVMTWYTNPGYPVTILGPPPSEARFKVYVEGEINCNAVPDGRRTLTIDPAKRYYILITNVSDTDPYEFRVAYD